MKNKPGHLLFGDGIHDDTAAIQARLDTGNALVCLPVPGVAYLISRPLVIHSNQEFRLDRWSRIRLAPRSNCLMLTNSDHRNGNVQIAVSGGIWDYDNVSQAPNPQVLKWFNPPLADICPDPYDPSGYHPERYRGILMRFVNVAGFEMHSMTLRNPVNYATQFARLTDFTISNIVFDYTTWNPSPNNMDGIHLDGGCRFGRIQNLKGNCYDDMVAVNADDGLTESPFMGEISDIEIDGLYAGCGHSAVRLLSTGSPIRRIAIRNIHGDFYRYVIGFTYYDGRPKRGIYDDIVLENIHVGKALPPPEDLNNGRLPEFSIIRFQSEIDVSSVRIRNLVHREETVAVPTIEVEKGADIDTLTVESSGLTNLLPAPIPFLRQNGRIGSLALRDISLTAGPGAGTVTLRNGTGTEEHCIAAEL